MNSDSFSNDPDHHVLPLRREGKFLHRQAFLNVTFDNNTEVQDLVKMHKLHLSCVDESGLVLICILQGPHQCKLCKMLKLGTVAEPEI